ncbi:MAG: hypothetical protein JXR40_06015, partial [Pontiellaceae bacterium]|nr:hypothetical protein [Pontiellaceae bacterium]
AALPTELLSPFCSKETQNIDKHPRLGKGNICTFFDWALSLLSELSAYDFLTLGSQRAQSRQLISL